MKYLKEINFKTKDEVLFFDIETAPIVEKLPDDEKSPLYINWDKRNRNRDITESLSNLFDKKAGLNFTFGKIVCISLGYIVDGQKIKLKSYIHQNESDLISEFFKDAKLFFQKGNKKFLCGFHILDFDIPFLNFRSMVHQIEVPSEFDIAGMKAWNLKHIIELKDLVSSLSFTNPSLDNICFALDIKSPKGGEVKGENVAEYYYKGKLEEIKKYCESDVVATANVFCKCIREPQVELFTA